MNCLIIVPAYNEEENIANVLTELIQLQVEADILVINDGSSDRTEEISRKFPVLVVSHPCNLGYGTALQTGFKFASKEGYSHLIQFDSDGQHSIVDLQRVYSELCASGADVVIGSRFLGRSAFHPGASKMWAIRVFRAFIWVFTRTRITDPTSGLRGMSRSIFEYYSVKDRFPPDYPDADTIIDILLRSRSVVEVPIGNNSRQHGESMHSGLKPVIYMMKVSLSIFSVVLNHWTRKEVGHK